MIDYAKITGERDGNRLQVKLPTGETLFAPLVVVGNSTITPTDSWLSSYKDHFLAVVTYQGSTYYDPLIIGFLPVKNAKSEDHNVTDRLFRVLQDLVQAMIDAKVNTQIGPQPFMADTQQRLSDMKNELDDIDDLIEQINIQ